MSVQAVARARRARAPLFAAGAAALAVALLAWAGLGGADAVLGPWLVAWIFTLGFPAGATVLILTRALTGGEWLDRSMPVLRPMALSLPLVALLGVPLLFGLPHLYRWAGTAEAAKHADVARLYLNQASFVVRFLVILVAWSAMGLFAALRGAALSALAAGLMLLVYGVTVTFAATDWLMSIDARWASSAFPAFFAVLQVASAICAIALSMRLGFAREATRDLGRLVIAVVLGLAYLCFIQFLVMWSGNLPEDVVWYVDRAHGARLALVLASFGFGSIIPFCLMLPSPSRALPRMVSFAACCLLLGILLQDVWIAAPVLGGNALLVLPLSLAALTGLWAALLPVAYARLRAREARHG